MAEMRADKRRYAQATDHDDAPSRRRTGWLIIAAGVVSVASLALGWLQLQSVQRAIGIPLPDMMVGGYDAGYVQSVRDLLDAAVIERYQSVHYLWFLLFPVAFAGLIILLVRRFSGRSPLRWLFYAIAVLYAAVHIAENFVLEATLASVEVTASEVAFASFLTTAKFVLFAAAVLAFALSFALNRTTSRRDTAR
ncbi:hypothetical protein [Arthrobacter tumbae]|uniref:hypothetical protein n=1 Tax=Arthrobacter tumbae TaxID=163874 RepID=UPI00195C62B3|nr:hypothetical protein [Arthrobacter tumbae]MBM7782363.1 hypothetical protein [Arthrobacter tumbae]